ncbi:hypothetical protein ES705_02607 [subsurface metagenome]
MKLLLCDAVIIIDAHKLGLWRILKAHYRIHFVSTVLKKEAQYFKDDLQLKYYLDFRKDIASGRIIKISMPIEEIQTVIKKACENRLDIQAGEAESIAALLKPEYQKLYFCTADKAAIAAAHLYNVMSRVVSFEKCLKGVKSWVH